MSLCSHRFNTDANMQLCKCSTDYAKRYWLIIQSFGCTLWRVWDKNIVHHIDWTTVISLWSSHIACWPRAYARAVILITYYHLATGNMQEDEKGDEQWLDGAVWPFVSAFNLMCCRKANTCGMANVTVSSCFSSQTTTFAGPTWFKWSSIQYHFAG